MRPSHEASVERKPQCDGAWARSLRRVPAPCRPRLAIDDFHGIIGPTLESLTPLARCHASRFTAGSVFWKKNYFFFLRPRFRASVNPMPMSRTVRNIS